MKIIVLRRIIFTLLLLILFLIVVVILVLLTLQKKGRSIEAKLKKYKYLRLDPLSNETTSGTVTINEIEGPQDFLFYEDGESNYVLISNFGTTEYQCTGKCYCGPDLMRRIPYTQVPSISRGLTYLVAALSSALAVSYAQKHFENICKRDLFSDDYDDCDDISSETSCDELDEGFDEEEEVLYPRPEEFDPNDDDEFYNFRGNTFIYWCTGHCIPNIYTQFDPSFKNLHLCDLFDNRHNDMALRHTREIETAKSFGCEKLKFEVEIWIDPMTYDSQSVRSELIRDDYIRNEFVKEMFMWDHLEPVCITNSIMSMPDFICEGHDIGWVKCQPDNHLEHEKDIESCEVCEHRIPVKNMKPVCAAHDNSIWRNSKKFDRNESVKCRHLVRKTKAYRLQYSQKTGEELSKEKGFEYVEYSEEEKKIF